MLRSIILTLGLLFISFHFTAQGDNTSTVESIIVKQNNVSGGGFQSDVTITSDGQTVYSSADVSGVFKSTDGGLLFNNVNQGFKSPKVASLAITEDNDQILYAGTGDKGGSGGLFRSINGGLTWNLTAAGDSAQFAGNHSSSSDPLPQGHPRSNGDLIVIDKGPESDLFSDDLVIVGSYKNGVRIFTEGGEIEASAVNVTGFVRSVARNVAIPHTVFAAIYFEDENLNGIYRIDYSDPFSPNSTLEYQTAEPEEITVLESGRVYAAIGGAGLVQFNGTSWNLKNTGLSINDTNRKWAAITGYVKDGTDDVLYAGVNNLGGNALGTDYSSIWRSVDNGDTWTPLVDASLNVSDVIYGQTHEWWYRIDAFTQGGLGKSNSVVSSIDVARSALSNEVSDDIIYVSGRGGIWKSEDGGTLWQPAVNNMQATSNNDVAVNPNNPSQVALANTDYELVATSSKYEGSDVMRDKPTGAESRGYNVIFDPVGDQLILGVGDRDTNSPGGGEVYVKASSEVATSEEFEWTNTNLQSATASNNGRVRALGYGYHDGSSASSQTILAAVEGEGVYRYYNGTWTLSNGVEIGSTKRSRFLWPDNQNSGIVYLLDLSAGFYRSTDGGQNWTNAWPEMSFKNNDFYNTGYLTADDNNPTTLYLSLQGDNGSPINTSFRVYRITNANSGLIQISDEANVQDISHDTDTESISRPGPIVLGPNGRLWLTQQQNSPNEIYGGLYVMENPESDSAFTNLTTETYRNRVPRPSGIDVSSENDIYISQSGTGLVKLEALLSQSESAGCFGDINGDGLVTVTDLLILIATYGQTCSCPSDLTGDGLISAEDLLQFNVVFGQTCP